MSGRLHRFGGFSLNTRTRELRRGDVPVALSPRAFDCLAYLIEQRGRAVGKRKRSTKKTQRLLAATVFTR